jgi:hypothetical protein
MIIKPPFPPTARAARSARHAELLKLRLKRKPRTSTARSCSEEYLRFLQIGGLLDEPDKQCMVVLAYD